MRNRCRSRGVRKAARTQRVRVGAKCAPGSTCAAPRTRSTTLLGHRDPSGFAEVALRDVAALHGARRLVSLGHTARPHVATPQDAMEPVRRLVKWIEAPPPWGGA